MAVYRFVCGSCSFEIKKIVKLDVQQIECPKCSAVMERQLPKLTPNTEVRETVDSFMGVSHIKDQKEILDQRRTDYFWEVEVPRLIQTHSLETALEEGWLVYNDKGELEIGKPKKK